MDDDLEAQLRRADPDRWLASRLISDDAARADVLAILAFEQELTRVRDLVSDPFMGEIRLTWWSETVEAMAQGGPARAHPAALALAQAVSRRALSPVLLDSLIEARIEDLSRKAFTAEAEALAYVDATSVVSSALVLTVLSPATDPHMIRSAARAYGVADLLRAGRLSPELAQGWARGRIAHDRQEARKALKGLPVAAFPAVAHAALARTYGEGRRPGQLARSLTLFWASLTGSI
jgi:phytoene synthase